MPNGFHGSKDEWARIESPLRALDAGLREYAERFGMTLSRNYHNWPERSLTWCDGVNRRIQIFREGEDSATYAIGVAAWQLTADGYFVRQEKITDGKLLDDLERNLPKLLEKGRSIVSAWSEADLLRVRGTE